MQEVVGRPEREVTDVIETEDVRDQSRVMGVATGNGYGEPVVIGGRLDRPPGRPHGGRRVLLPALAVTRGGRLTRALFPGRLRNRPCRQTRWRAATTGSALSLSDIDGDNGVIG